MNDPAPSSKPRSGNAPARYLFMLLLGLVVGIIATVMLLRALESRKTLQDHLPHAVMHLQSWHMEQLSTAIEQSRCGVTDTMPHLQALRTTVDDIQPAFPGLRDDQRFVKHVSQFRAALNDNLADPPGSCREAEAMLESIGQACKSCHQDYRG